MKELLVRTGNREMLDRTLQQLGGLVSERPEPGGNNVFAVRDARGGDTGFLRFAIEKQGYGEVVTEREV